MTTPTRVFKMDIMTPLIPALFPCLLIIIIWSLYSANVLKQGPREAMRDEVRVTLVDQWAIFDLKVGRKRRRLQFALVTAVVITGLLMMIPLNAMGIEPIVAMGV